MYLQDPELLRARSRTRPATLCKRSTAAVRTALERARAILQDMSVEERREAIAAMPQKTRMALLTFMQSRPIGNATSNAPMSAAGGLVLGKRKTPNAPDSHVESLPDRARQSAQVRIVKGTGHTKFQAIARFRGMRFYTRESFSKDAAVEHQRILTRLLAVLFKLEASSPRGWQEVAAEACRTVLSEAGTSETNLGLRAFVQLRAHKHLGRHSVVNSPADSLCKTFEMHRRFHQARSTSWHALRAEWLHLLQQWKGVSANATMRHIDASRRVKLRGQLATTLRRVDRALTRRRSQLCD